MCPTDLRIVFELVSSPLQDFHQWVDPRQQQLTRLFQQQRIRGVDDVARRQTIMNEPRRRTDILGKIRSEGDDVVIGCFLDLVDTLDRERCF
jgi:hypothetical protein